MKRKTFKYNDDYFDFYDKMANKINILSLEILNDKIILKYEEKIDEEYDNKESIKVFSNVKDRKDNKNKASVRWFKNYNGTIREFNVWKINWEVYSGCIKTNNRNSGQIKWIR